MQEQSHLIVRRSFLGVAQSETTMGESIAGKQDFDFSEPNLEKRPRPKFILEWLGEPHVQQHVDQMDIDSTMRANHPV